MWSFTTLEVSLTRLRCATVLVGKWKLFRLLVRVVFVMAALRSVVAIVTQLGQLLIEGLDGSFLLAKDFLYQLVAMGFERLLLCEEFIDRIVGHVDYDPIAGLPAGAWDGGAGYEAEPRYFRLSRAGIIGTTT